MGFYAIVVGYEADYVISAFTWPVALYCFSIPIHGDLTESQAVEAVKKMQSKQKSHAITFRGRGTRELIGEWQNKQFYPAGRLMPDVVKTVKVHADLNVLHFAF